MTDSDIPAPRVPSDPPAQSFTPVRVSTKRTSPPDTVILFYLDDVPYSIPREVPATFTVAMLNDAATYGENTMISRMMTRMLGGEQAMQDLEKAEGLTNEQLEEILSILRKMSLAAAKKVRGK